MRSDEHRVEIASHPDIAFTRCPRLHGGPPMTLPTQPLRDEHRELRPHVDDLREVADLVGEVPADTLAARLREASAFLHEHLLRHARAEEAALYPAVERVLGAPGATATMRRDHVEVARLRACGRKIPIGSAETRQIR